MGVGLSSSILDKGRRFHSSEPFLVNVKSTDFGKEGNAKVIFKTLSGLLPTIHRMSISIADFSKVEMKVGRISSVEDIPQARNPMYKLTVDIGDGVTKKCVAGIKKFYTPDELLGKLVVAVVNLEPKNVAGVVSECMLLAAFNEEQLAVLRPDRELSPGTAVR
jgi:methionine--tRNA ligase beta chain